MKKAAFALVILLAVVFSVGVVQADNYVAPEPKYYLSDNWQKLSPVESSSQFVVDPVAAKGATTGEVTIEEGSLKFGSDSSAEIEVNAPKAGGYYIEIDYNIPKEYLNNLNINVMINGEYQFYDSRTINLSAIWKDSSQEYKTNEFGAELNPKPVRVFRWQTKRLNSITYNLRNGYLFNLKEGKNTIKITNNNVEFLLGKMTFCGKEETITAEQYIQKYADKPFAQTDLQTVEAEKYYEKAESYSSGTRTTDPNAYPYDAIRAKINVLRQQSWSHSGDSFTYQFDIKEDGLYYFVLKYMNDIEDDKATFINIYIDDKIPFEEFYSYKFQYTSKFINDPLAVNGNPVPLYFEKGLHTIKFESTGDILFKSNEALTKVINQINDIAIEIKRITGNKSDKNRKWEIELFIPGIRETLVQCSEDVNTEYEKLVSLYGKSTSVKPLKIASERLLDFSNDLDYLVNNMDQFSTGTSSVSDNISLALPDLLLQGAILDRFYITKDVKSVPKPRISFFGSIGEGVKKLVASFTTQYEAPQTTVNGELNVWAVKGVYAMDLLREMTSNFEAESGVKVNLSTMPDETRLLLAVSAGNEPDAVIGVSPYRPFDFALRGALLDLRQFDDFGTVLKDFAPDMLVPFVIGDSCYGLPEAVNPVLLYYRKDILHSLGLEVPKTWDDVIEMLPTLSRYDMNFNTVFANAGALKHFGCTVPIIQQFGGKIYAEDGSKVELGDPKTVEAFTFMTDLFTKYSLPESISSFYNQFKKGVAPIGLGDLNTYFLLIEGSPELTGQWGIAPSVGTYDDNGKLQNYQLSVATSSIVMKNTKLPKEAWAYLKWYMSEATQVEFSNQILLRFGPEYMWNTANIPAFSKTVSMSKDFKDVFVEQLRNTGEIPRNPAYFMVERQLSNAWNSVVFDGRTPRNALDTAITTSNREIAKKLKEFGYMDEQGKMIKPFTMATREKILSWEK